MSEPAAGAPDLKEHYRIERAIGRGGMATVYEAFDLRHGRRVAVKVVHPELAAAVGRTRFLREIAIVARLSHPHIVPLFDSGERDGSLYYVMPLVSGETLRERIRREGTLGVEEALRVTRELSAALGYAHRQGVIHRDVKPENVLLSEGIALLADFGIARAGAVTGEELPTHAPTTGQWGIGTPSYMSPEQVSGGEPTAASDVYALACVLFEMLAGRPPFVGASAEALLRQHVAADPPALESVRAGLPQALGREIARALAKDPAARPETAARFAEAVTLARDGGPAAPETPHPTEPARRNLPRERSRFVGREAELARALELLATTRLLTITGIGGAGKTRLALKLAERALGEIAEDLWFVDLAPVIDPARVPAALASAMGLKDEPDTEPIDAIVRALGERRALLVLDNCEHVLDAATALANDLLGRTDALRLVATSREGLGVEGELAWALRSLSLPAATKGLDLEAIAASEATRLFVDRARAADPGFELGPANASAVAEICRRLDGIPLALELAAARVRILSVEQIQERLDDRFRLLTGSGRAAVPRHQTLEATIRWSVDALSPEDQRRLRALSVFQGGWSLEAASRVVAPERDEFATLDALSRLVDKSLVVVDRDRAGEPRYRLLETVRQFARDRLVESGEAAEVSRRHADAFLELADRAYRSRFERESHWADALETEHDNLRAALSFLRDADAEGWLTLSGELGWFWYARGHLREGDAWVQGALAATHPEPARLALARALWSAALLGSWQGRADESLARMRDTVAMLRALGEDFELALALEGLGWTYFLASREPECVATFEESLSLQTERGDPYFVNRARVGLGQSLIAVGETARARALAEAIVRDSEAQKDPRSEHFGHHFLADCALIEGRYAESLGRYGTSLRLADAIGDVIETSFEIQGVAMSLAGLGRAPEAVRLGAAADAAFERVGADIHVRFWDELVERHLAGARRSLAPAEAEAEAQRGRALPFAGAVAEALRAATSGAATLGDGGPV